MKKKLTNEPWIFDEDDLDIDDPNYKISRPYRIWHEYLRISPSFYFANRENEYRMDKLSLEDRQRTPEGQSVPPNYSIPEELLAKVALTAEEKSLLPADYVDVVKTFNGMAYGGWDFMFKFRTWWLKHAADIFGYRHDPSPISLISVPQDIELNETEFQKSFKEYLSEQRKNNGMHGFSLVAIPLNGDKKKIITSLNQLLQDQSIEPLKKKGEPLYQLQKGKQLAKIAIGLRLLWLKSLNPDLELWRLGIMAGVTKHKRYKILDPKISKHTEETKMLSENLATMTSHRLKEALIIMENAARGRFPCSDATLLPEFNHAKILNYVQKRIEERICHQEYIKKSMLLKK